MVKAIKIWRSLKSGKISGNRINFRWGKLSCHILEVKTSNSWRNMVKNAEIWKFENNLVKIKNLICNFGAIAHSVKTEQLSREQFLQVFEISRPFFHAKQSNRCSGLKARETSIAHMAVFPFFPYLPILKTGRLEHFYKQNDNEKLRSKTFNWFTLYF